MGSGNPWDHRRSDAHWIASLRSGVRHFADWRDNVLVGHDAPELVSRLQVSRSRPGWFDPAQHVEFLSYRASKGLPSTDLASEDSEDALTWNVFQALRRFASSWPWWRRFGLTGSPEITFWPRGDHVTTDAATAYLASGRIVEPHHSPATRSEIDCILSTPHEHVLIESKWKGEPRGPRKDHLSSSAALDEELRQHLSQLSSGLLKSGLEHVLAGGAYQTLRHLLYVREVARVSGMHTSLVYLLHGPTIGIRDDDPDALEDYRRELFQPLFEQPLPRIVLWGSLLADLPSEILDAPLDVTEVHAGATLRDYLSTRRLAGRPAPLAQVYAEVSEPPLILDDVIAERWNDGAWENARRKWSVVTPRAKLLAKYANGTSALFGHYVYRYPHRDPHRISSIDIAAADRLMGANISAQAERAAQIVDHDRQEALAHILTDVPIDASIEDARFDERIVAAIAAVTCHGVGLAIATKLLCIKRPALIPMMDSVVQGCIGATEPLPILQTFRRLITAPGVSAHLDALAAAVAAVHGFAPSRVRVLDELIWFDWNIRKGNERILKVVGFDEWGYDREDDACGVFRL